jgi:hypothetical protein
MGAYEYVPRVPDAGLPGPDAETVQPDAEAVQVDASASDASLPADAGLADAGPAADTGSEADVGAAPDAGLVVTPDARPPGRDAEPTGKDVPYATAADGASAAYDLGGCGCGDPGAPGLAVGLSLLALLFRTARTSRRRP